MACPPPPASITHPVVEYVVTFDANYNPTVTGTADTNNTGDLDFSKELNDVPVCITINTTVNPTITFKGNVVWFSEDKNASHKKKIHNSYSNPHHQFRTSIRTSLDHLSLGFVYHNDDTGGICGNDSDTQSRLGFQIHDSSTGKTIQSDPIIDNGSNPIIANVHCTIRRPYHHHHHY